MFLIDKYCPKDLEDIFFNRKVYTTIFPTLVKNNQNILVYGYDSSGKKTFVNFLLKEVYGSVETREEEYEINNYGSNTVKVKITQSHYHFIFNPLGSAIDKYIIQEIIVQFCKKNDKHYFKASVPYKTVLIHKADMLSHSAQSTLRRIIEEFSDKIRFFLICKNTCSIIDPIKSRLLEIPMVCPNEKEVRFFINNIVEKEGIALSSQQISKITNSSNRDIKTIFYSLECYKLKIELKSYWMIVLDGVLNKTLNCKQLTLIDFAEIRDSINKLFISNIETEKIFQYILQRISLEVKDLVKVVEISKLICEYDTKLKNATRYVLHFEALFLHIIFILHR